VPRPTGARPSRAGAAAAAAAAAAAPAPEPEAEPDVRSAAGAAEEVKAPGILARAKALGGEALTALGDGLSSFWSFLRGIFG